jgi:glycosyltransferase involved in cell wall biosynthesis
MQTADLMIPSMRTGDATSNHLFETTRILQRQGLQTNLYCNYASGPLPEDIRPLVRQADYADYEPRSDLLFLEYPGWCPLAERIADARGVTVFSYQGVTPPSLWATEAGREHLQISEIRTQLAWFAHLATAASSYTADELHRHSGYPRERIRVVPYSVVLDAFKERPAPETLDKLRGQWQVQGKRILLYVGRVAGNKRIDLAISALAQLADDNPALHLLIVGDTEGNPDARALTERLRQQATELGLRERVTFTGHVDNSASFFFLAEALLLPSLHEGFGVPLIEAMAARVPVVASASGSMPWVLDAEQGEDGSAGLLHTPSDAADLARQIHRVLHEPELRAGLVARGTRRVEAFTPAQFERNVLQVIAEARELAKEPRPAAQNPATSLYMRADVALRKYKVRSGAPVVGKLIEWLRVNSTSHVKEAYVDPIIEQQVNYNRLVAQEMQRLQSEVLRLKQEIAELRNQQ